MITNYNSLETIVPAPRVADYFLYDYLIITSRSGYETGRTVVKAQSALRAISHIIIGNPSPNMQFIARKL